MARLATGIQGFDGMVQGGLPVGSSVVLQGPPGQEKLSFALTFLAEGLKAGASGLVVISSQSPDAVLAELRNLGVDMNAVTNDHRLRIVDWYSWSEESVADIEERGLVLRSSIDLTNLGVALSRAIAALSGDEPRRAVIELLSPATNVYEVTQVYAFAQSAKKKFDRHGFTSLVLLEKDMHSGSEITTLHQPFDGVIEIERTRSGDRIVRKIGVLHLTDTAPDPSFRVLEIAPSGMRVVKEVAKAATPPPSVPAGLVFESQEERARRLTLIMQIAGERLKLNPRDTDALFAMAAAQATLDDARGGLQFLERLSELDPNYPGLWVLKTKLHARLGEADRARQSRLRAQEVEPAEPTPAKPTVPCPMCDTPVALDATVCGNCGVKFAPARKLEDELEDLGHAAIQEMVHEGFQEDTPPAAPRKPAERKAPKPEPRPAPAPRTDVATPPKPAVKPTPKKGLTNGLVLGRGTGRRTGMTNGLRGRTNGLRGRTNGLTNGLGRTNGLTNGVGRTNGLTNGLGRTNGLTNGLGRTNGLTNGLGRTNGITNGITNGLGRTNGLTNGLGGRRPSGFRSTGFRGMMRTAGWKLYLIPLVVVGLFLMPLFFVPEYNGPVSPIRIDGQFGDWSTVSTAAMGSGSVLNPNVDVVRFGVVDNLGPQAFYVQVVGTALQGGGTLPGTMDSARIFVDTDGLSSTGYRIDGLGADRLIEVSGYVGVVRFSTLWEFDANRDTRDWGGWIKGTGTPAAASGSQIEVEADWLGSGTSSIPFVASVHTASWNGQTDEGDFPVSSSEGSLSVVTDPQVPDVITGSGVSLLRLSLTSHRQAVSLDSITVQIVGTAPPTAGLSLRLMDGGTVLNEVAPTSRDVTFSFPAIMMATGSTLTLSIVGDFAATNGDTFGLRLPSGHPFGLDAAAVGLRENPGARTLGYLGLVPGSPQVDGGFDEWTALQTDATNDVSPRANANIDLAREGALSSGGSTFLYADVTGRILHGTTVPEFASPTPVQGPPAPSDTDRDMVPDSLDPLPLDFNNDGIADANTNGDYDGDLIIDYGFFGGTDYWLNTTLPITFPVPYAGLPVSVYIGPTERPAALGEDAFRLFLDVDNSTTSGYLIGGIGADRLVEIRGKDGQVTQSALLAFSGSFPGEWSWTPLSPLTVALGYHAVELSVSLSIALVYAETGDFWGSVDSTAAAPALAPQFSSFRVSPASRPLSVPWTQIGPQPTGTLIDSGSNSATTVYNHQRKVVRAGDVAGDAACDATNSDGCWYAVFYDQLAEAASNTQASTETITTGSKIAGIFPTDIQTENAAYVQYRESSYFSSVGAFNIGTGGVGTTVPVTVGFQPKVALFWWSGRTTSTDSAGTADHQRGFGVAVSTTDRRAVCSQSQDNVGTAAASSAHRADAAICSLTTASVIDGLADLSSMDANGFTLIIDDAFLTDLRIHYVALGGSMLTNAATGIFTESAATGNQDITTVGFQPDAVILFSSMISGAPPGIGTDGAPMMVGFAAGAGNPNDVVWAGASDDGAGNMLTLSYDRAGESIALFNTSFTETNGRAEVDAWLSNGFSLNWNERFGSRRIEFLALKGGSYVVGDLLTLTTTGTVAESGFGFSPKASLFVSHNKVGSTVDIDQAHDELSIGAFSSTTDRGAQCVIDENSPTTSDVGTAVEHDEVYCNLDVNMAIEGLMGVQSVDSDGFTLVMNDPDPVASFVGYIAFGGSATLEVRYDWSGVPSGDSYTLQIKGYRQDEDINAQVLTPPSTWNTRIAISATTNTMYTYTLTSSEYNSGAPAVRFVDAGGAGGTASDFWIDYANVASNSHWDRVILMRSSDTSGSTWGSQIILASGRTGDSALLLARDSAEPSIAIDSGGFLHLVWVSASASGNQNTLNLVRYTRTTVAYPTQSELEAAGNWETVTNVDDVSVGFMPTVSTDTSNNPHIAWSESKTAGTVYYKNKAAGTWRSTVSWGTRYTGPSVDVSPPNNYVSLVRDIASWEAEIGYRSNTGTNTVNSPKTRTWDVSAWSSETERATSGSPIRAVRMAWSTTAADTRIIVTLSDDGWLDAYVCTPTCTVTNNIGQVWTSAPTVDSKRFDIVYETVSGEAMLVYSVVDAGTTHDLAYRTYTGSWSAEQYIDDTGHAADIQYEALKLSSDKGTNRIGLAGQDGTNNDATAWIWDGSAWGNFVEITADLASAANLEPIAVAWETNSGHGIAAARDSGTNDIFSREYTTSWSAVNSIRCGPGGGEFLSLKANPVGDDMILVNHDNGATFGTCYWTGSAWANGLTQDATTDTGDNRIVDFAWENTGSKGLLVWGTTAGQITYRTFTAPNTWGTITNVAMGTNMHPWVQLRTNPRSGSVKILGAVMEATANDLGAVTWDGTTFTVTGASTFTADVGTTTWESFELEYRELLSADVQYVVCKDLATSNCDAGSEFTKFDGTAGADSVATGTDAGSYPSLATTYEANGDLWVAYAKDVDATTRAIYARFLDYPSAGWQAAETVDSLTGTLFTKPSIGIDGDNNVHALYAGTSGPTLYYASRTGGSWSGRTTVDSSSDNPTVMVRAPSNSAYSTASGAIYWKSPETYFYYIPEFEEVILPIVGVVCVVIIFGFRSRSRSKRSTAAG